MPAAPASPLPGSGSTTLLPTVPHFSPPGHTFGRKTFAQKNPPNHPSYLTVERLPPQWQWLIHIVTGLHWRFACVIGSDSAACWQMPTLKNWSTDNSCAHFDWQTFCGWSATDNGWQCCLLDDNCQFPRWHFDSFDDSWQKNSKLQCCWHHLKSSKLLSIGPSILIGSQRSQTIVIAQ